MKKHLKKIILITVIIVTLITGLYLYFVEFREGSINRDPLTLNGSFLCRKFDIHEPDYQDSIQFSFVSNFVRIKYNRYDKDSESEWTSYKLVNIQPVEKIDIGTFRKFAISFDTTKLLPNNTINVFATGDYATLPKHEEYTDYDRFYILGDNNQKVYACETSRGWVRNQNIN